MHPLKLFLISILIPFSHQLEFRSISNETQGKIDDFIENVFLPMSGVNGMGLAIVQNNGQVLYTTGYGFADREAKILNGNQTQYLLGSVTKSFTAMLVAKTLHESFPELGEAVMDTPIRKLVPQSNFFLDDSMRWEYATFRDLLSHKMCFPREDFQLMAQPFETTEEILERQRHAKEKCGFRTQFVYNNQMVLWASELIGHLSGKTFEQSAKELLEEIGMLDSAFITNSDDFSKLPLRSKPYYVVNGTSYPMNPELIKRLNNAVAVGGLFVTPNDMAQFLQLRLNLGKNVNGKQVIPEQVMSWLIKPSNLFTAGLKFRVKNDDLAVDADFAYGLGIMIGSYDGWQRFSHTGYFPSYRSELSWYPELNLGIYTGTHEAPCLVKHLVLHNFILETLLGAEHENASQRAVELLKEQRKKAEKEEQDKLQTLKIFLRNHKNQTMQNTEDFSSSWHDDIIGKYSNKVTGQVEIFQKYNLQTRRIDLYLSYGKWGKGWLTNVGSGEAYEVVWDTDLRQDYYASTGNPNAFVTIKGSSLTFVMSTPEGMRPYAEFERETGSR